MREWWQWFAMVMVFTLPILALGAGWLLLFMGAIAVGGRIRGGSRR
jgi:hypothetical protein